MNDNKSAFRSSDYDDRIKQTLPYYEQFYKEIIELVKIFNHNRIRWLDVGCGTGKMVSVAYENVDLEKFVFCDSSKEMIKIVKERFRCRNAEFSACNIQNLIYSCGMRKTHRSVWKGLFSDLIVREYGTGAKLWI